MKKLASIFILLGIILGSFFAQEANAATWKTSTNVHADGPYSGNHNFHKRLIFSEISSETEDSELRSAGEFDFIYIYNVTSGIRYIKNILSSIFSSAVITQQEINSLPIFLAVRSIQI